MRNDLDSLAQVVATPFLAQHRFVDLAGGEVVHLVHASGNEALVVAQVQIGFGAVFGDEHFTVLEGAHRARIDVDVGVELQHGHLQTTRLENGGERRGGDALAQGRHHTAGDKYVFGHRNEHPGRAGACGKFGL
ncbi:hypothetical protein D3C72_1668040 [compost metagenome]